MGDLTPVLGLYKPDNGETGWGDEVDANFDLLEARFLRDVANVKDFGAVGDDATDDSGPIQDAIDTGLPVFFPSLNGTAAYKIGTPLVPNSSQTYFAIPSSSGYGQAAARLECMGGNNIIWDLSVGYTEATWLGLVHEDRNYGISNAGADSAFYDHTASGQNSALNFSRCQFIGLQWAFDIVDGSYLSCWQRDCLFYNSPSRFDTTGADISGANNNHWEACRWQTFHQHEYAVSIETGGGDWFSQCYAETLDRGWLKLAGVSGVGVSQMYFEQLGLDGEDYVGYDGVTRYIPVIDITRPTGLGAVSNVSVRDVTAARASNEAIFIGCTDWAGGRPGTLYLENIGNNWPPSDPDSYWDVSAFSGVHVGGPLGGTKWIHSTINDQLYYPSAHGGTVPLDALTTDFFSIVPVDNSGYTIEAPSNPTTGRRITIELNDRASAGWGTITFNSVFVLTNGAWVNPATGKAKAITFIFNGTKWTELYRTGEYTAGW